MDQFVGPSVDSKSSETYATHAAHSATKKHKSHSKYTSIRGCRMPPGMTLCWLEERVG